MFFLNAFTFRLISTWKMRDRIPVFIKKMFLWLPYVDFPSSSHTRKVFVLTVGNLFKYSLFQKKNRKTYPPIINQFRLFKLSIVMEWVIKSKLGLQRIRRPNLCYSQLEQIFKSSCWTPRFRSWRLKGVIAFILSSPTGTKPLDWLSHMSFYSVFGSVTL